MWGQVLCSPRQHGHLGLQRQRSHGKSAGEGSVADPDTGSGIGRFFGPWIWDGKKFGSWIFISDPQHWEKAVRMVAGLKWNAYEERCLELRFETLQCRRERDRTWSWCTNTWKTTCRVPTYRLYSFGQEIDVESEADRLQPWRSWDGILGHGDKRLESFAPCYSSPFYWRLKVHKIETFLAPILNFVLFHS